MTQITLTPNLSAADVTAVFATKIKNGFEIQSGKISAAQSKKIEVAAKAFKFSANAGEVVSVPGSTIGATGILLIVGLGENPNHETFRKAAGVVSRNSFGTKKLALVIDDSSKRYQLV